MQQIVSQINCGITINVKKCKKHHISEKDNVWNIATYNYENGKYLASIMDDPVITRDKAIEPYSKIIKTFPTSFNEKNITCKAHNFYILLAFF